MENVVMHQESHLNGSNNYVAPVEEQPSMEVEDSAEQSMGVWKPEEIAEAVASLDFSCTLEGLKNSGQIFFKTISTNLNKLDLI